MERGHRHPQSGKHWCFGGVGNFYIGMHGVTLGYIFGLLGAQSLARYNSCHISVGKWDLLYDTVIASVGCRLWGPYNALFSAGGVCTSLWFPSPVALGHVYEQAGHCLQCSLGPWNCLALKIRPLNVYVLMIMLVKHGRCVAAGAQLCLLHPCRHH